ncbi:ribosomal protein L1 [Melanomma pulvis-pyrius CBS 109.77]|uniref:Ribosomal protein L1 n=1 Tax=Melanomma pulvis-pyrius CBS 109.77 TaxID=1314802 RepID=A0A6A6XKB6_9PLEO|nr:ribosomal protein L1 [Melanomma pulvis-pyrius CBS 109.77]
MAKSKAVTRSAAKGADAPLTTKPANGARYELDPVQVERAATALVAHMKKHVQAKEEGTGKKNLEADADEAEPNDAAIFLNITTKKHIVDHARLRPNKIPLPNPILANDVRICLITKDPQRKYKDLVADDAFPEELRAKIGRVVGIGKLKKKYKTYETQRQLLSQYDVFLADDRVTSILPATLGNVFYKGKGKRPIPVDLKTGAYIAKDDAAAKKDAIGTAKGVASEIEKSLSATLVHMSPSANTSIKIGKLSMTPDQIKQNVEAVVSKVVEKFVPQGWKNVRALHIKGPSTKALPIWLADELWADEEQVLEEPFKHPVKEGAQPISEKKRKWNEWEEEMLEDNELAERRANVKPKKVKAKKEKTESSSISRETRKKLKTDALKSVQTPLIAG